jgi:hypothetical protein
MTKAKPLPTAELIRHLFSYDEASGAVKWSNPRSNCVKKGDAVGVTQVNNGKEYLKVHITIAGNSAMYQLHRIIWLYVTGEDPGGFQIDHIDGDGLNNRFLNLRKANQSENNCNSKRRKNNSSGFKGVSWSKSKNKWEARIKIKGLQRFLGHFLTPELAHMAYCKAAAELHGDFARGA